MMPAERPLDIPRPIAIARQKDSRSLKRVVIVSEKLSTGGEWLKSKVGQNSGCRSCADDKRRPPRRSRELRRNARRATLPDVCPSYPYRVAPCLAGVHH